MSLIGTMGLAGLAGFTAVWRVTPALHSPLMCRCPRTLSRSPSSCDERPLWPRRSRWPLCHRRRIHAGDAAAVARCCQCPPRQSQYVHPKELALTRTDVFGGFLITKRMLDLFRRPGDPPDYGWLWAAPTALFAAGLVWAYSTGEAGLTTAGYTVATFLSIGALTGLSSQVRASFWPMLTRTRPQPASATPSAFSVSSSACSPPCFQCTSPRSSWASSPR